MRSSLEQSGWHCAISRYVEAGMMMSKGLNSKSVGLPEKTEREEEGFTAEMGMWRERE